MTCTTTETRRMSTYVGIIILGAATNTNVLATGGWLTSHAILVAALSAGVFAGARVVGVGAGKMGLIIIAALVAGELFNMSATAERIVVERENGAAPLKDALAKHNAKLRNLDNLTKLDITSPRLAIATQSKVSADAAYDKELREGGRCKTICEGLRDDAAKAQAEVIAAIADAETQHQAEIDAAKAEVDAHPLPASATPLADRLNIPAWSLDLIMAGLLSLAANGLAGALIAYGSHGKENETVPTRSFHVSAVPVPVGTPPKGGNRGARSDYQVKANMIAKEMRDNGIEPRFHVVKTEFQRRFGSSCPNVTAHRASRN